MKLLIAITACVLMAVPIQGQAHSRANDEFSVTLRGPQKPIRAGAELRLQVTITNISDHNVLFARTPGITPDETLSYQVEIQDSQGRAPKETPYLRNLNENPSSFFGSFITITLGPGKSFDDVVVVTRLYAIATPGKYRIRVARGQQPLRFTPKHLVKSNEITVTVAP